MKTIGRIEIMAAALLSLLTAGCLQGPVHLQNGHAAVIANQYAEAIREYSLAINSKELSRAELAEAHYNRGWAYKKNGDIDKAFKDYTRAIELDRDYIGLGIVLFETDFDRLIALLTRAIELYPEDSRGYFFRGIVYESKGEKDKAGADFRKAKELRPELP